MAHENFVEVILGINSGGDTTLGQVGEAQHFGNMRVQLNKRTQIHPFMLKNEVELYNTTSKRKHTQEVVLFEFNDWPILEVSGKFSTSEINNFLTFFCLVRTELDLTKDKITIITYDADGGISGSSVFVAMYDLLQQIDEVLPTDDDQPDTSNRQLGTLDIFKTVNDLRNQRSKMVNNYGNYRLLFKINRQSVEYALY